MGSLADKENKPLMTMRDTMLNIARKAIACRAEMDGYSTSEYDPTIDAEGYITSLLVALHHWCDAYDIEWQTEIRRAQEFFEEDLRERI